MRNYINEFMIEGEYLESDREFLLNAYDMIMSNNDTKKEWERILSIYDADIKCDYYHGILVPAQNAGKVVGVHPYTTGLLIFMCMLCVIQLNVFIDQKQPRRW